MVTMGFGRINCCLLPFVCLALLASLSSATVISDGIFGSSVLGERRLLQAKKQCPISFEFQNYTIVTSRCKGPQYPVDACCQAFKDFACPFAEELNDLTTDCASSLFSYINLKGSYPPGLFANQCHDGQQGLECLALPPVSNNSATHDNCAAPWRMMMIILSVAFLSMQFA